MVTSRESAIDELDSAIIALRGVSAWNQNTASFNAEQFAAADHAMEAAGRELRAAGLPELADATALRLPEPELWMVLQGTRLVEKWRAGRAILELIQVREAVLAQALSAQVVGGAPVPELPRWVWHDAEGLVRIASHPVTWVFVGVWNVGVLWWFSTLQ